MSRKRKAPLKCDNSVSDADDSSIDEDYLAVDISHEMEFNIPQQLKIQLENDSFYIQRRNVLIKLPKSPNVFSLLQEYYDYCHCRAAHGSSVKSLSLLKEVLDGILTYFDFTLYDHLLYTPEKKQYENIVKKRVHIVMPTTESSDKEAPSTTEYCTNSSELPSRIYGVEHLLRLFVVLPGFLARTKMPQEHSTELQQCIGDFLTYICSQTHLFNKDRYEELPLLL